MDNPIIHSTTILGVYRNGSVAVCGDGQVTLGNTVLKSTARKVRRLFHGKVVAGFAGASADAFTLFEAFEARLEEARGNLFKASVGLAKEWRTDRTLRRLEAMLVVGDSSGLLVISGQGDVLEPDDGLAAIGSGGPYALAAARAFVQSDNGMSVEEIARRSLGIAAGICIYTNTNTTVEAI